LALPTTLFFIRKGPSRARLETFLHLDKADFNCLNHRFEKKSKVKKQKIEILLDKLKIMSLFLKYPDFSLAKIDHRFKVNGSLVFSQS
jgi:hypothetical protein